ncbi:MAG TPA: vitamin B12-dependent ribonucleotide reductase [Patescibacteria group bacterium]|nr:vitamin B12-dependent ribonucleotide reductase [Patescibacteria group bacterium]
MVRSKTRTPKKVDNLRLEDFEFGLHKELLSLIERKVGKRPKMPADLTSGNWTEQSLKVLAERYLIKDENLNVIETPEEMCWRVAWDIASAEAKWGGSRNDVVKIAREFYHLLLTHEFLPNSPTLMNAGTGNGLQYSACFVLPVGDSLVEIFDAIKYQALIHQTGGGTGFSFSRLRPRGATVKSSHGTASGPVSFMSIFDAATNEIKQGGRRRGANMGILRVDHPDIMEFIHCKEEGGITNFNISVAVTDEFMKAYDEGSKYNLYEPRHGEKVGTLDAREVFDEIAKGAWKTGDPGMIFIDRINNSLANPVPMLGPIESTNPCGEQPLYPYDSCNLGSIFLNYFVKEVKDDGDLPAQPDRQAGGKQVDWEKLRSVARLSTRFLDNVIEMNPYPLPQIRQTSLAIRRVGLGVGGWADMLTDLEIAYDSEEAILLGEEIMKVIYEESLDESEKLAAKRGPFPLWSQSIYKNKKPRRNSTVTTIAPTGSISIIAGSSSGIEPLFALAYQHIVKDKSLDRTLTFVNPALEKRLDEKGFWTEKIRARISEEGVIGKIEEIDEETRKVFGTAHEIHHDWHIKHQAAFQKYTENAVSKTINMNNNVTVDDIKSAYLLAWKTNCKGVTVFRDGCKDAQVLNLGIKEEKEKVKDASYEPALERPFIVSGSTYKVNTPVGNAFITLNQDERGEPLELFVNVGKAGSDVTAMAEALGRTISIALRFKGNLSPKLRAKEIAEQLSGIGGRRSVGYGPRKILSLPDAVAMALSVHMGFKINGYLSHYDKTKVDMPEAKNGEYKNGESKNAILNGESHNHEFNMSENHIGGQEIVADQLSLDEVKVPGDICPTCGSSALVYQEGCSKCYACGHSEC